jgi:hypothetical protein
MRKEILFLGSLFVAGCAGGATEPKDLPIGDQLADDLKDDGVWGAALTCKTAPSLPGLSRPHITVSLEGLTLHLVDEDTGFDKVFPVGVGAIDPDETSASFGESLTYAAIQSSGNDFAITPSSIQTCKTWWTDPDTGKRQPVFAGLPFLSWDGPYAIHGPIDNFRAPNGGNLRRGFVSHGCVRMEAADVLEVYARIKGVSRIPVHVQREPERDTDGRRVDVAAPWVGAEGASDGDCGYTGGFCKQNRYSDRGFCSARCTSTCADRAGYPSTFCVADPDDATLGICVPKMIAQDQDCRPYDHLVARTLKRFHQTVQASVCVPGSPGWVGDHCFADADCDNGTHCAGAGDTPGVCTESCARYCTDEPGWPTTFCADDATLGQTCLRECTPASNASECPADSDCTARSRVGDPGTQKFVCVPRT